MSLVLELPPELEAALAAEAARLGLSLHDYVLRLLAGTCGPGAAPRTGAELLAYGQGEGLIGTRPTLPDAPAHARALRERNRFRRTVTTWPTREHKGEA